MAQDSGSFVSRYSFPDFATMRRAAELAVRASMTAHPNPMVGCVIADSVSGRLIAEGWHERPGKPHAEPMAMAVAGDRAIGADMYISLEPCVHSGPNKRTPPCAPRVIESGVKRVAVGILDPNPAVSGRGVAALREAGIEVHIGLDADAIAEDNRGFLSRMARGRPWVTAKWAMSLDGKTATHTGESKWISGSDSRRMVHRLRAGSGAVMVGIGTVLADDPMLTARDGLSEGQEFRQPMRVVVDPALKLPMECALVKTAREVPVLVMCGENPSSNIEKALTGCGVEVLRLPSAGGRLDLQAGLELLGKREVNHVLVEGGAKLLGSLLDQGMVDEVLAFIAPLLLIGGVDAPGAIAGGGVSGVRDGAKVVRWEQQFVGRDVLIRGLVTEPVSLLPEGSTVVAPERSTARKRKPLTPTV